jgi:hypothetical protein
MISQRTSIQGNVTPWETNPNHLCLSFGGSSSDLRKGSCKWEICILIGNAILYQHKEQNIILDSDLSFAGGEKAVSAYTFKSKSGRFSIRIHVVPVCSTRIGHFTQCLLYKYSEGTIMHHTEVP